MSGFPFGEYKRLLEKEGNWEKLRLMIDRKIFCADLDAIRKIRNDVMHFDPDGVAEDDLKNLCDFAKFLQQLT